MSFFHRLFNPHCEDCNRCKTCEILERENAQIHANYERLLNELLRKPESGQENAPPEEKVSQKHIPWAVKKQMLEAEDREKARILRDMEKLEKDMKLEIP